MRTKTMLVAVFAVAVAGGVTWAQQDPPRLTGPDPMPDEVAAPPLDQVMTDTGRRMRAYPEQAPTIPHRIDGHQITINVNECMDCHRRQYVEETRAPMVSVTHFIDRDGQMLGDVSPGRYVCTVCHVTQTDARPLVANQFIDVLDLPDEPEE